MFKLNEKKSRNFNDQALFFHSCKMIDERLWKKKEGIDRV